MKSETSLPVADIAKRLNESVLSVVGAENIIGFEKAFLVAKAAGELKKMLSPEYMKPIMELQGNRLGFKTDKDATGGYPEDVVKNCLIEAVLWGVQPCGNHFNIIAGNCYITKEGYGYLLANLSGLKNEIIPSLPRVDLSKGSAAAMMKIKWNYKGSEGERDIEFAIKANQYMGADGVIGKATRKARKWLYDTVTGNETPDGDVQDIEYKEVSSRTNNVDKVSERITLMISSAKTMEELSGLKPQLRPEHHELFDQKQLEFETQA